MADRTKIEWTDATWNPITGCSVVSPGCTNCYAMRLAGGRLQHHRTRKGLTSPSARGPVWNGEVRFNEPELVQPLNWREPRRIFVCAHGDLFHESVPDFWIDRVFAVMAAAPQHTFQVLTKRADRMRSYVRSRAGVWVGHRLVHYPLPNVWLGVSAEDQARADERVIQLLRTPAAVRWVSAEPLLGPIRLWKLGALDHEESSEGEEVYALSGTRAVPDCDWKSTKLDWVVAGGEGGPRARPANPQWFRDLRDQCAGERVPFLFKQWGSWVSVSEVEGDGEHFTFPDGRTVRRVGKRKAGRLLDGRLHDEYPEASHA